MDRVASRRSGSAPSQESGIRSASGSVLVVACRGSLKVALGLLRRHLAAPALPSGWDADWGRGCCRRFGGNPSQVAEQWLTRESDFPGAVAIIADRVPFARAGVAGI